MHVWVYLRDQGLNSVTSSPGRDFLRTGEDIRGQSLPGSRPSIHTLSAQSLSEPQEALGYVLCPGLSLSSGSLLLEYGTRGLNWASGGGGEQ